MILPVYESRTSAQRQYNRAWLEMYFHRFDDATFEARIAEMELRQRIADNWNVSQSEIEPDPRKFG